MTDTIRHYLNNNDNNIVYYDYDNLKKIFLRNFDNIYNISTFKYPIDCLGNFNVIAFYSNNYDDDKLSELCDLYKYHIIYNRLDYDITINEYKLLLSNLGLKYISIYDLIKHIDENMRLRSTSEYEIFINLIDNETDAINMCLFEISNKCNNSQDIVFNLIDKFKNIVNINHDIINYCINKGHMIYDILDEQALKYTFEKVCNMSRLRNKIKYLIKFYESNYNRDIIINIAIDYLHDKLNNNDELYNLYNLCIEPFNINNYDEYYDVVNDKINAKYVAYRINKPEYYDKFISDNEFKHVANSISLYNNEMKSYLELLDKGAI